MTKFQLFSVIVFACAGLAAYSEQIKQFLSKLSVRLPATPVATKPKAASLVKDMITVADLRDRLSALNCQDGVDACTLLLRVMVEYKSPKG